MSQHSLSVNDPAWKALVVAPEYRSVLLTDSYSTVDGIIFKDYSDELRAKDATWVAELRQVDNVLASKSDADVRVQLSEPYLVVHFAPWPLEDSYVYKSFMGFKDFTGSLSAESITELAHALSDSGFHGAIKIDLRPGATRFRFNQLVMYAGNLAMINCGEAVAAAHFHESLAVVSRGVDPRAQPGRQTPDWHHYLLQGGHEDLSERFKTYLTYQTPPIPDPCDSR